MSWMLAPVIISPVASHTVDGVDAERVRNTRSHHACQSSCDDNRAVRRQREILLHSAWPTLVRTVWASRSCDCTPVGRVSHGSPDTFQVGAQAGMSLIATSAIAASNLSRPPAVFNPRIEQCGILPAGT